MLEGCLTLILFAFALIFAGLILLTGPIGFVLLCLILIIIFVVGFIYALLKCISG